MFLGGIILIIIIIYLLNNDQSNLFNQSSQHKEPLDILNERYVNGEISDDEYLYKKELLNNK